jgi:hypothetical protein
MAFVYPQIINGEAEFLGEFPGTSLPIKTLRDSAIFAHKIAITTRTHFPKLQEILDYIALRARWNQSVLTSSWTRCFSASLTFGLTVQGVRRSTPSRAIPAATP